MNRESEKQSSVRPPERAGKRVNANIVNRDEADVNTKNKPTNIAKIAGWQWPPKNLLKSKLR